MMRSMISAGLIGLLCALAVMLVEPGHRAYRPHELLPQAHLHAMLVRLDRLGDG